MNAEETVQTDFDKWWVRCGSPIREMPDTTQRAIKEVALAAFHLGREYEHLNPRIPDAVYAL